MKRNKYKDYLWYTALAVFILCIIEGILYYHDTENTFLKISLNIQNAIKAYKIDPDIKQAEAIRYLNESGGGVVKGIITYLYCASVIVAPFCTIGALTVLIMKPANYIRGLIHPNNAHRMLVLGQGNLQENFVNALAADCRLTVVETGSVTEERKATYLRNGIKLIQKYSDMTMDLILESLKLSRYDSFLLCDDNAMENLEHMKLLLANCTDVKGSRTTYQQIYICCKDSSTSEIIRQYYDSLETKTVDINIIDINQMAVNKMFLQHPVYQLNDAEHRDVHMGIIGFGEFGQHTLLQGLNMSVLSADSHICIDVYDKHMPDIIGSFMKHFSIDILDNLKLGSEEICLGEQTSYYELQLPMEDKNNSFGMDGTVTLRFWKTDAQTLSFHKTFKKCHTQMPFTYLVIAMGDTSCTTNTLMELEQLLYQKGMSDIKVPIAVRTKDRKDIVDVFKQNCLFEIVQSKDIYSYASLTNSEITEQAKIFNHRYNVLYDVISSYQKKGKLLDDQFMLHIEQTLTEDQQKIEHDKTTLDVVWHEIKIFDRESSIAQALHQDIKKWLVNEQKVYSLTTDKEELERIEHRRWTLFMITHGFRYEKSERKNVNAKTHPCILSWEHLKIEKPDTLEYDFTPYYILQNSSKE